MGGAHFSVQGLELIGGEPLMSVTCGQCNVSCKASPPSGWHQIILLGNKRHMYVNNLSRVALDSREARIRTRDLLITSPTSQPPRRTKVAVRHVKK